MLGRQKLGRVIIISDPYEGGGRTGVGRVVGFSERNSSGLTGPKSGWPKELRRNLLVRKTGDGGCFGSVLIVSFGT